MIQRVTWGTTFWLVFLIGVILGSLLSPTGGLLVAGWWVEAGQKAGSLIGQATRPGGVHPWWWGGVGVSLGLWRGLGGAELVAVGQLGVWLGGVVASHWLLAVGAALSGRVKRVQPALVKPPAAVEVEVTLDLEPLLAELGDLSPGEEGCLTAREALTAQIERIRATCFQHPVSQVLQQQGEAEVQRGVKRVVEEALGQELDEYLGGGRYTRTGAAKPADRHRSGSWVRSWRTQWGQVEIHIPQLRRGNLARPWRVLRRYERSFGPWLDTQLHLYRLGLSQQDLRETLQLSFGQELSVKAIEHLTTVAQQEMTVCQQARLWQTPSVIGVDGVNLKVLCTTGAARLNERGQSRPVKQRQEKVLLLALGIWPEGSYQGLCFERVDPETKASWKQFFSHLVAQGLDPRQLQGVVSDGRPGLDQAIHAVFPQTVKPQRCICHKLKNLADNLTCQHLALNPVWPYRQALQQAKQARARAILQETVALYHSPDNLTLARRLAHFQQKWTALEPKAVRCFLKDFDLTLTYRQVPFPQPRLIRTPNLLERFFREFRRRADEIGCFGSPAQAETWLYLIMQREKTKHTVA